MVFQTVPRSSYFRTRTMAADVINMSGIGESFSISASASSFAIQHLSNDSIPRAGKLFLNRIMAPKRGVIPSFSSLFLRSLPLRWRSLAAATLSRPIFPQRVDVMRGSAAMTAIVAAADAADGRRRGERSPAVKATHTRGQVASPTFDMDFDILSAHLHLKLK